MKRTYNPPTVPLEDAEQRIIFQWAAMETAARPELGLLYAIPNGGKRAIKTAIALKAQGVKSGVPDMCLPVARNGYHGLYIELKRQKGGTVSETQKSWLTALAELTPWGVCGRLNPAWVEWLMGFPIGWTDLDA